MTASLADANGISMDALVTAFIAELGSIFLLEEDQRTALKAFLDEKDVFEKV